MKRTIIIISLLYCYSLQALKTPYQAITITPIVHCAGEPLSSLTQKNNAITTWQSIPFCGKKGEYACPRIHQILYNTPVTILEERDNNVKISITSAFYEVNQKKCNIYWADKAAFMPLSAINKDSLHALPPDFDFTAHQQAEHKNIISLIEPFKSSKAHCTFSAGTRFVAKNATPTHFNGYFINPQNGKVATLSIPRSQCINLPTTSSWHKQRAYFIKLLRHWAQTKNGSIPYVWGGTSYINRTNQNFKEITMGNISYFDRSPLPKYGFDCAGLISRAAQTCGIPFFFKNTTTIKSNLKPITTTAHISDGDIIWIQGHVMVVSDKKENKLIEARSYGDGYGKVHELTLAEVFKNINSYQQLMNHINKKKPLERLDTTGNVRKTFGEALILSLKSAVE